jgi:hypothetical protein
LSRKRSGGFVELPIGTFILAKLGTLKSCLNHDLEDDLHSLALRKQSIDDLLLEICRDPISPIILDSLDGFRHELANIIVVVGCLNTNI